MQPSASSTDIQATPGVQHSHSGPTSLGEVNSGVQGFGLKGIFPASLIYSGVIEPDPLAFIEDSALFGIQQDLVGVGHALEGHCGAFRRQDETAALSCQVQLFAGSSSYIPSHGTVV